MNHRQYSARTFLLPAAIALTLAFVVGCSKSPESQVPGTWKDTKGDTVTLGEDKTFSTSAQGHKVTGKWSYADKKVTINLEQADGKSIADQLKQTEAQFAQMKLKPDQISKLKKQIEDSIHIQLALSDDGKTLTSINAGPGGQKETFTKQDSK